jgi:hypothetical protein
MLIPEIKTQYYLYILTILLFIYNIYNFPKYRTVTIVLSFIFVLLILKYESLFNLSKNKFTKSKADLQTSEVTKIFNNIYNYTDHIIFDNLFPISKLPRNFMFIEKNPYIYKIIFDLRFLEKFNKDAYYKLIILLEYFIKYYYKTITDEYDFNTVIDMLMTIRKTILNIIEEQVFSIPTKLNLPNLDYDIGDTDEYLKINVTKIRAFTYKKIKILASKNKSNKIFRYKSPNESNLFTSEYEIY